MNFILVGMLDGLSYAVRIELGRLRIGKRSLVVYLSNMDCIFWKVVHT